MVMRTRPLVKPFWLERWGCAHTYIAREHPICNFCLRALRHSLSCGYSYGSALSVRFSIMPEPHKLLVANRGEIAVRILRTAKRLQIPTVAVYTRSDATAPHVLLADEAVALCSDDDDPSRTRAATCTPKRSWKCNVHFAGLLCAAGITWLGPRPEIIHAMGLKHQARALAAEKASKIGFPVMLKSTAGGGGMGLVVCRAADDLHSRYVATEERAKSLFKNGGLFLERYFPAARHVEVQVFGNGLGHVIHMGERECSIQRRHQKVIEETPNVEDVRERMCAAAVRLCQHIKYNSAGTVEFIVDDVTGEFFFLEMNTRLQVEHPVTEVVNPGLDIVELMILQGIAERFTDHRGITSSQLDQRSFQIAPQEKKTHAIEVRVYCENAAAQFKPCPGVLQHVQFMEADWLRVETWVGTGTTVTPFFDPLVCKLIVTASDRSEAISRLRQALWECKIYGPPNNLAYLRAICESEVFQRGNATTTFLDEFNFTPRAVDVISGGLETTVQDHPGRRLGLGIPRSGPMDSLAFRAANILVGNDAGTEALEMTLMGCKLYFHTAAVIAVTGAPVLVTVVVGTIKNAGFRAYLAIRGGFPEIPLYLGSKSTSMGLGGYQGRALAAGDCLALGLCEPQEPERSLIVPHTLIPSYPTDWVIYCLAGPHCDEEFITPAGIEAFFATQWTVSASSNRMGIRLEGPQIEWARKTGGEGGSHPSNIHDNGYALGTININGDTPVILTNEGPDMGGYLCMCTVATAELWKLGQLRPGCRVQFKRISFAQALHLSDVSERYLKTLVDSSSASDPTLTRLPEEKLEDTWEDPKLHVVPATGGIRPRVVFRQAGDSAILVEYGGLQLDFSLRARIHAFETEVKKWKVPGIWALAPCIRSTMAHFDPHVTSQRDLLAALIEADASLPDNMDEMTFPGRKITFPIVLDDRWNREALQKYMRSIRDEAAYLPSNIAYLANNNGLEGGEKEALRLLVSSNWLVFGVGFYLACPFLVPIDPRCRLVGQKMNPSRTYTPRGAIGIAGLVAAIYPIESPGGYQLYGRTLPPWQTWGKGPDFDSSQPWLLRPFDQVAYEVVSEDEYMELESQFDAGRYRFKIEDTVFSMSEYNTFVESIADEVLQFKQRQTAGVESEEARERELFLKWDSRRRQQLEKEHEIDSNVEDLNGSDTGDAVVSSLSAHIWKIKCSPGDIIRSGEDALVILEAMKTEVKIEAGEENIGKKVKGFGRGVKEGAAVNAGDVLVVLE
ncbi:putative urea carboxylase [Grifola frondosa]|uniref:Putative urea carboxylase n=1 Tax=Grifola frondosa TaxID=5627 RepID=A0A1C7MDG7_GRIFR|nr:putative urea carboxylase [Grifola frondosa]